jgi:hypothetical protein
VTPMDRRDGQNSHTNTQPAVASAPDHIREFPADTCPTGCSQSQLDLPIAQDRIHLWVALQAFRHAQHRVLDGPDLRVFMVDF